MNPLLKISMRIEPFGINSILLRPAPCGEITMLAFENAKTCCEKSSSSGKTISKPRFLSVSSTSISLAGERELFLLEI